MPRVGGELFHISLVLSTLQIPMCFKDQHFWGRGAPNVWPLPGRDSEFLCACPIAASLDFSCRLSPSQKEEGMVLIPRTQPSPKILPHPAWLTTAPSKE